MLSWSHSAIGGSTRDNSKFNSQSRSVKDIDFLFLFETRIITQHRLVSNLRSSCLSAGMTYGGHIREEHAEGQEPRKIKSGTIHVFSEMPGTTSEV